MLVMLSDIVVKNVKFGSESSPMDYLWSYACQENGLELIRSNLQGTLRKTFVDLVRFSEVLN
jgi:hypothetical protein